MHLSNASYATWISPLYLFPLASEQIIAAHRAVIGPARGYIGTEWAARAMRKMQLMSVSQGANR